MKPMATEPAEKAAPPFEFSGGALCLDFANTMGSRQRPASERLGSYTHLLRWGEEAGLLEQPERERLERRAARRPGEARGVFERAVTTRENIYRIFSALAAGNSPPARDVAALNATLPEALSLLRLEPGADGFRWTWSASPARLDRPLWAVVRSAADLLTSSDASLVCECASDPCNWLFLDRSRTGRRRWCDMKSCGNRAKARRHYERKKKAARAARPRTG